MIATGLADPIADGFGQDAIYLESHDEVSDYLRNAISNADVILVKGSRSAQMDRVIDALVSKQEALTMLLLLAGYLSSLEPSFAVFQYLTLRSILGVLTALLTALLVGPWVIRSLENRQIGQS